MSYSQATLVQRIRYELGDRPWEDSSCTAASASSTITGATSGAWVKGDIGEFLEDGDTFLVISESSGTITATRSYWGSTGAGHTSKRVLKNPRYTFTEITNAITAVINGKLFPRVYKSVAATVTPDAANTQWYNLASVATGLIDARQLYGTNNVKEGRYGMNKRSERSIDFRRNMTTGLVASGVGVRFPTGFYHDSNTVNIDYAAKITDTVGGGNYSDFSAGEAVAEAIIYGAVAHLEAALENRKPRKPRGDRETLRGASVYEQRFQEALNWAEEECNTNIPLMRP